MSRQIGATGGRSSKSSVFYDDMDDFDKQLSTERHITPEKLEDAIKATEAKMRFIDETDEKERLRNNIELKKKLKKKEWAHKQKVDEYYLERKAEFRSTLYANLVVAMNLIQAPADIFRYMMEKDGIFDEIDQMVVFSKPTKELKVMSLMLLLYQTGSEDVRWSFINALRTTGQDFFANIIAHHEDDRVGNTKYVLMNESFNF